MSLGATKAWTICTKRAGVWIFRPILVCFAVGSGIIWSALAIFELFLSFGGLVVSFELGVLSRKCKGTREYVCKSPPLLLAQETAGIRECGTT